MVLVRYTLVALINQIGPKYLEILDYRCNTHSFRNSLAPRLQAQNSCSSTNDNDCSLSQPSKR